MRAIWSSIVLLLGVCTQQLVVASPLKTADTRQTIDEILHEVPLIDGHNDLPWQLWQNVQYQLEKVDLNQSLIGVWETTHTDIPRLQEGHVGGQFWAVYMSCDAQYKDIVRACLDQVDVIRRMIDKYSWIFKLVTTADGIMEAFNEGKIGSMIGIEGGHCIDSSIATLRMFYNLGARYMTITHNCDTPWADTNSQDESGPVGLSDFGVTVIDEMNRLGMIVDLSHVSAATMREALQVSRAPVIFSHSSAYGLCPSNRNVPDDVLQLIKDKNGLVMVNFYPNFVTCSNNATTSDVADHIDYIRDLIGPEYIGIGADYDGINRVPVGLEDTSKYPNLFQELQNRGYPDVQLKMIAGENLIRVFKEVEQVSQTMQASMTPHENLIPVSDLANKTDCRAIVP